MKLLFKYNTLEVTAITLIISGIMLQIQWFFNPLPTIQLSAWFYVLLSPFVPMALFFLQFLSMNKNRRNIDINHCVSINHINCGHSVDTRTICSSCYTARKHSIGTDWWCYLGSRNLCYICRIPYATDKMGVIVSKEVRNQY